MTTKTSALDGFKMDFEELPDKRKKIYGKQPKIDQKKADKKAERSKRTRKPSAISLFFKYWIEVVTA